MQSSLECPDRHAEKSRSRRGQNINILLLVTGILKRSPPAAERMSKRRVARGRSPEVNVSTQTNAPTSTPPHNTSVKYLKQGIFEYYGDAYANIYYNYGWKS